MCVDWLQHLLVLCRPAMAERKELGCLALPVTGRNYVVLYS